MPSSSLLNVDSVIICKLIIAVRMKKTISRPYRSDSFDVPVLLNIEVHFVSYEYTACYILTKHCSVLSVSR